MYADDLIAQFKAAGIRVSEDPADLQAPAVWVQHTGSGLASLDGTAVTVRLVGILPDGTPRRVRRARTDLVNKVNAVVTVRAYENRSVLMPDNAMLPGWQTTIALRAPIPAPE